MSVKERILTIRLIEKMKANPAYTEAFGIVIVSDPTGSERQIASDPVGSKP